MKRKILFSVIAIATLMSLSSCDEHEMIDTSVKVGDILCDDHSIMKLSDFTNQNSKTAVGVIFSTGSDDSPALAVTLDEISPVQFSSVLGFEQGTSCDVTKYDGFVNTTSLQNTVSEEDDLYSPMAIAVFRQGKYGQSLYIPSVAEWRLLSSSLNVINPVIRQIGGTPVTVTPENGGCWYWSSTEVEDNNLNQAWLISAASCGSYQQTPKDESHPVRTIISVY